MGSEGMGVWELPRGWEWRRLGEQDVAEIVMGQSPPGKTYNDKGKGLPFFQGKADFGVLHPSPRKWCTAPKKVAEPGDVLISVRAPVGPTNLCAEICCIGRGLAAIRPGPKANSKFLLFALRAMEPEIARRGQGSTFAAITKRDLVDFQIPFPPLNEQRHIVARIEELFARIEEARRLRAAADQDAEELMPAAIEMCLEGLETIRLGSIIESYKNGIYKKKHFYGRGFPSIRMFNIQDGKVVADGAPLLEVTSDELDKYGLGPGDILVNRVNSRELVGKTGLVGPDLGPCTFESKNIRVRIQGALGDPGFVVIALNSNIVRKQIQSLLKPAIGQATINQRDLDSLAIPFPPLPKQRCIAEYLDSVQDQVAELKRLQAEAVAELERLSGAVLARAFRGAL